MRELLHALFIVLLLCACERQQGNQGAKQELQNSAATRQPVVQQPKSKPTTEDSPNSQLQEDRKKPMLTPRDPSKPPIRQDPKAVKLTYIISGSASTGSIDPSSFSYGSAQCYTPSDEESKRLLDDIVVNGKVKLREFFAAVIRGDKAFLADLAHKPKPQQEADPLAPVGGSSSFWSLECGQHRIISDDERFTISKFPSELLKDTKAIGFSYDMMGMYCHKVSSLGY